MAQPLIITAPLWCHDRFSCYLCHRHCEGHPAHCSCDWTRCAERHCRGRASSGTAGEHRDDRHRRASQLHIGSPHTFLSTAHLAAGLPNGQTGARSLDASSACTTGVAGTCRWTTMSCKRLCTCAWYWVSRFMHGSVIKFKFSMKSMKTVMSNTYNSNVGMQGVHHAPAVIASSAKP